MVYLYTSPFCIFLPLTQPSVSKYWIIAQLAITHAYFSIWYAEPCLLRVGYRVVAVSGWIREMYKQQPVYPQLSLLWRYQQLRRRNRWAHSILWSAPLPILTSFIIIVTIIIYAHMPISPCDLCLDDEAVRIAISVRLGMAICVPHNCHCGSLVDAQCLHSFVCRKAWGKNDNAPRTEWSGCTCLPLCRCPEF